jgi:hypothetical protein
MLCVTAVACLVTCEIPVGLVYVGWSGKCILADIGIFSANKEGVRWKLDKRRGCAGSINDHVGCLTFGVTVFDDETWIDRRAES